MRFLTLLIIVLIFSTILVDCSRQQCPPCHCPCRQQSNESNLELDTRWMWDQETPPIARESPEWEDTELDADLPNIPTERPPIAIDNPF